jgi:hypothetical protein
MEKSKLLSREGKELWGSGAPPGAATACNAGNTDALASPLPCPKLHRHT